MPDRILNQHDGFLSHVRQFAHDLRIRLCSPLDLSPENLEQFEREYAYCHDFAESQRPKLTFRLLTPIMFRLALVAVGGR